MSPKVGTVEKEQIRDSVWAASSRLLTDFSAEEILDLPALTATYPGVLVSSSATANAFGDWVEIVANVGTSKRLIYIVFNSVNTTARSWNYEIGEGAVGSEATLTAFSGILDGVGALIPRVIRLDRSLSDNARLVVRVKDTIAVALAYSIFAMYA